MPESRQSVDGGRSHGEVSWEVQRVDTGPMTGLVAVLTFSLGIVACGGDNALLEQSETSSQSETSDQEGPSQVVDLGDFAIPAPPGGEVIATGSSSSRIVVYPVSEFDRIVAFYQTWRDEVAPVDSPELVTDEVDKQMGLAVQVGETEINMVSLDLSDGELVLALSVIGG